MAKRAKPKSKAAKADGATFERGDGRPRCGSCGSLELFGPGPIRTSAHPNSSMVLLELPGSRFHDVNLEGTACLACGRVDLSLSKFTLDSMRASLGKGRSAGRG